MSKLSDRRAKSGAGKSTIPAIPVAPCDTSGEPEGVASPLDSSTPEEERAAPPPPKPPRRTDLSKLKETYNTNTTYGWLLSHCKGKRNASRNTAFVRGLQSHLGRSLEDDASCDLKNDAAIDQYLKEVGRSDNRRSALTYLRSIIREPVERGFAELVRHAIVLRSETGGSMATLAREIGVDRSVLWRFANNDVRPGNSSRDALRALERISRFAEGSLTQHIASWSNNAFIFREQYIDLANPSYSFRNISTPIPRLSGNAIPQVQAFFEFKTCDNVTQRYVLESGLERNLVRKGKWTRGMNPRPMPEEFEKWKHFSAASIAWATISKVCGFVDERREEPADSLAAVLDVRAVEQLLEREVNLSGGCYNNGHENHIAMIKQLLHPVHGFIVQLPELFEPEARRLGIDMGDLPWKEFVAACHAQVKLLPSKLAPNMPSTSRATRSRDKKQKLHEILSLPDAYGTVVYPTLQRMFEEMPPASALECVKLDFEIKYLTMGLFAACPMRVANWGFAEWDKHLRKRDGQWWVHIPKNELKNRSFVKGAFSFLLPNWTSAIVDRYHRLVKPRMAVANPDAQKLVLAGPHMHRGRAKNASKYCYDRTKAGARVCRTIRLRMAAVTKQLWNLPIAPHDWRDIYATDYLNKHPDAILIVAAVLNDKIETVLKMYAQPDTARLSRLAAQKLDAEWSAVAARRKGGAR